MPANRFRASSLVLAIAVASSLVTHSARGDDWPQWRGADRANRSAETGLFATWKADGPPLAWVAEGMGSGYASKIS